MSGETWRVSQAEFDVRTGKRRAFVDITPQVSEAVRVSGIETGVCHVFVQHTTAGVTVNENADPSVALDILRRLETLAPDDAPYTHGEGNSPAHVMASLVGSSAILPVTGGSLALGRWQGVFLAEFDGPRPRRVRVTVSGEGHAMMEEKGRGR
ncbi:MAG: secondary thiamine-phosphate synthase enzyme YjbQ [Bacillota bacterium]